MRRAGLARTLPCAGIIQIRFKGYFSPARTECDGTTQDPRVSMAEDTPCGLPLATGNKPIVVPSRRRCRRRGAAGWCGASSRRGCGDRCIMTTYPRNNSAALAAFTRKPVDLNAASHQPFCPRRSARHAHAPSSASYTWRTYRARVDDRLFRLGFVLFGRARRALIVPAALAIGPAQHHRGHGPVRFRDSPCFCLALADRNTQRWNHRHDAHLFF